MDESERTHFPVWRALALAGFAASALTAIALFSAPSSASADEATPGPDAGGSSLIGAVTGVVGSLQQPIDAVGSAVDSVSSDVVAPVAQTVDAVLAQVPVVSDVVDQTVGTTPVADLTGSVTGVASGAVATLGDVVGGVGSIGAPIVPQPPVVQPGEPGGSAGSVPPTPSVQPSIGPPLGAEPSGAAIESDTLAATGRSAFDVSYQAFLAGLGTGSAGSVPGSAPAPARPAPMPGAPGDPVGHVAVVPGSQAASGGGFTGGTQTAETTHDFDGIILSSTRRGLASDDALPSSPTFDSDTSPD